MKISRRELGRMTLALAAAPAAAGDLFAAKPNSKIKGVQIGVQTYSFRDRSLDAAIEAMTKVGLSSCELWQGHIEPNVARGAEGREQIRKWRLSVPLETFKEVRRKFDRAGIQLYAYNLSFRSDFSDDEVDRGFQMAKALGVKIITASSTVSAASRINRYATKHKILVGMHNHSNLQNPEEFAKPESFLTAMKGNKNIAINLDIGHFTAANFDPVAFIREHHKNIVTLHIKDRKKDQGANLPFGEGDTKIVEVLQLLRANKYRIPANIEYEYRGSDAVAEVAKCYDYCQKALMT